MAPGAWLVFKNVATLRIGGKFSFATPVNTVG
jgi:hypothetical protein